MPPNFVWSQGMIFRDSLQILVIFGYINKLLKFIEVLFINERGNFYILVNYQKKKPTIFLVFYLFQGIYTKIFMIFGSVHNFSHKFKHPTFLNKKEKRKNKLKSGEAQPKGRRPAHAALCACPPFARGH